MTESCIEFWDRQGFPVETRVTSFGVESGKIRRIDIYPFPVILPINTLSKKVLLRFVIRLNYTGTNKQQEYVCICAGGIKRLIVLQRDPMSLMNRQLTEIVNMTNVLMILQMLFSFINIF